jgi:hypothetical protein
LETGIAPSFVDVSRIERKPDMDTATASVAPTDAAKNGAIFDHRPQTDARRKAHHIGALGFDYQSTK